MTELIQMGVVTNLVRNTIYALPNKYVYMFSETAATTFEQANDIAFTAPIAVVLVTGMSELSGGFLKPSANAKVILKRF